MTDIKRKVVTPLPYKAACRDMSKPIPKLPEYTDEWIGAFLTMLDILKATTQKNLELDKATTHAGGEREQRELIWNAQIQVLNLIKGSLERVLFI